MRKIFLLLTVIACTNIHAQVAEGTIKYTMELEGGFSMGPNVSTIIYFKKDKSLTEMNTPVYTMKTLNDNNGMLLLMNANGNKFYQRKTKAEIDKDRLTGKTATPVIEATKQKKMILGYECIKSYLTVPVKGANSKIGLWHTAKISPITADLGVLTRDMAKKINGAVLEINIEEGPIKSTIRAVEISVKPVPESVFNLSTVGYTERKPGSRN